MDTIFLPFSVVMYFNFHISVPSSHSRKTFETPLFNLKPTAINSEVEARFPTKKSIW